MDLFRCLQVLVPGAACQTRGNDYEFAASTWTDARPMPTLAQCEAAWPQAQAAIAAERQAAQAEAALVDLRAYRDLATTTNAQDKAALKLLVRVAIGLIRLLLRKLEGTS